jgi:hypothetical protein
MLSYAVFAIGFDLRDVLMTSVLMTSVLMTSVWLLEFGCGWCELLPSSSGGASVQLRAINMIRMIKVI